MSSLAPYNDLQLPSTKKHCWEAFLLLIEATRTISFTPFTVSLASILGFTLSLEVSFDKVFVADHDGPVLTAPLYRPEVSRNGLKG